MNCDIWCIIETHFNDDDKVSLENYEWIGHNRKVKNVAAPKMFGGIGLLIKSKLYDTFKISTLDKSYDGILIVHFKDKQTDFSFIICCCYLPPEGSVYANPTQFFAHLISQLYIYNDVDLLFICGDINGRIGKHSDVTDIDNIKPRTVIDDQVKGHGDALIEFLIDGKLCVLNGRFNPQYDNFTCVSHKGKSVVDYIITPHDCLNKCSDFKVLLTNDIIDKNSLHSYIHSRCKPPDHSVLHCTFQTMHSVLYEDDCINETMVNGGHSSKRYRFDEVPPDFMHNDIWRTAILNMISRIEENHGQQQEIDDIYTLFCETVYHEMDTYLNYSSAQKKCRKRFKNHKPYWSDHLTTLWKEMNSKEHVYLKCRGNKRETMYKRTCFLNSRKVFDRELRNAERKYNKKLLYDIDEACVENPRKFWNLIKSLGPRKVSQIPMSVYDKDELTTDINIVLSTWKNEFRSLYNKPDTNDSQYDEQFYVHAMNEKLAWESDMYNNDNDNMLNCDITLEEVEKMTRKLKCKKACGFDLIPNEVLKKPEIHTVLSKLYNLFFKYGMVPSVWLKSIINPIPKSATKDPHVPLNYRGISLLSCVCKGYSSILNRRISNYCEDHDLFADEQNGFRRGRSCADHIFTLTSLIRNRLSDNLHTYSCFIDMQKAFDWIDHDLLFYKLLQCNIKGKMYNAIKSLYSHPVACVRINNMSSDWFETTSGVKQGDSLSPTLFGIYINDLVNELNQHNLGINIGSMNISILLFADDIVLVADSEYKLQEMLNVVNQWCSKYRLSVNRDKTKIMHFRKARQKRSCFQFRYGNHNIETVDKYKYLGVVLNENLNFNVTADVLAGSGGRALGSVINKFKSFKNVRFSSFTKMFETSVLPVMQYGAEIWGFKEYVKCERVNQRAARYYLGVHPKTPLLAVTGDTGWRSAQCNRHVKMINYWNRLVLMEDTRLTKKMFIYDYNRCKDNWSMEVKQLCQDNDMIEIFDDMGEINVIDFERNLSVNFNSKWKNSLPTKPKLRTYLKFKDVFVTEEYVRSCGSRRKRSLLAQFRMGVLPLAIETGRFINKPIEERICKVCCTNMVEDEVHMLCTCQVYRDIRNVMYCNVLSNNADFNDFNDEQKFIYLMTNAWKDVANFLDKAWEIRTRILYKH